ncbi:dihydrofolate reductase [Xylariaceae sp. FL0594]|nr:dihydrofolate reductase [Xylariaceae sp. FL0594]
MGEDTSEMPPIELTLVVAATRSMGIGRNGTLPWTGLRKEMAYFARVTKRIPSSSTVPNSNALPLRNAVIMGRKTWDSIPDKFRPLKGRLNIVVSRSHSHIQPPPLLGGDLDPDREAVKVGSLEQALAYLGSPPVAAQTPRVFIIGGAQIYDAALRLKQAKRILLTSIMNDFECDTVFPIKVPPEAGAAEGSDGHDGNAGTWVRRSKDEFDQWAGETVPEGIQEENLTQYEFQMWEKVG